MKINYVANLAFLLSILCHGDLLGREAPKLSVTTQWLKLLRYRPSLTSPTGQKSQVVSPQFFFHPDGARHPQKELDKTLSLFFAHQGNLEATICRFPARYLYLAGQLKEKPINLFQHCTEWSKFYQKLAPVSVYLVFSSYFINNPSSAYGHTFLRIAKNHNGTTTNNDMLDYATNFGADVTTQNALVYAFKGIFGLFQGSFTTLPYFYKIREYNDFESRDLYNYQLKLTPDQVFFLVAHIWEMGMAKYPYYYLDENCSYHIIALLDAINPKWQLLERLGITVLPIDTVKAVLAVPGLVGKTSYRPSAEKKFQKRVDLLSDNEKSHLSNFISAKILPPPHEENAKVYDAMIDYMDKAYPREIMYQEDSPEKQEKEKILTIRSGIDQAPQTLAFNSEKDNYPHLIHPSKRLLFRRSWKKQNFQLSFRPAFHQVLDSARGLPPKMSMIMGETTLTVDDSQLFLEEFSLIEILSLRPLQHFAMGPSFKVSASFTRGKWGTYREQKKLQLKVLGGATLALFHPSLLSYLLVGPKLGWWIKNHHAPRNFQLQIRPLIGILYSPKKASLPRLHITYHCPISLLSDPEADTSWANAELRFPLMSGKWELDLTAKKLLVRTRDEQLETSLHYFF